MRTKIAKAVRRLLGREEFDYRRAYAKADLERDYWSVVGPANREEFAQLGGVKLKHLIDLGLTPDSHVLDVGCGTGLLTAVLEDFLSDSARYVGTDLAVPAIEFCRSRFQRPNFRFVVNEMTSLPLRDEQFDAIVFYSVFTHTYLNETALLLNEARRLLATDGFIFADAFTTSTKESGHRGAVIVNERDLNEVIAASGLTAEIVMSLDGPQGSRRHFYCLNR